MINDIIKTIILTITPLGELRLGIPYAILQTQIPFEIIFAVAFLANLAIGIIVYLLLFLITDFLIKNKKIKNLYEKTIERVRKKTKKYVDKYGEIGLALFIAIPLPGSGVYTGALAAYIFGIRKKIFLVAAAIGVFIAATAVSILTLTGRYFI